MVTPASKKTYLQVWQPVLTFGTLALVGFRDNSSFNFGVDMAPHASERCKTELYAMLISQGF